MKYLVEPIGKGNQESSCFPYGCPFNGIPCNSDCYNYEICRTPTGPKMIHSGIDPIEI